ncbi:MAG: hypothetical protein IJ002_07705 [Clostridia bacterium]|nr:hypothetical protein [Clostridia bacterium]
MEKIFVKSAFALCFILFVCVLLCPADTWLESENRYIGKLELSDKSFSDRLPFRTSLMHVNRDISLALGKNEFAGAFFGENGYIFSNEEVSLAVLEKNLAFADELSSVIETHLCVIPSKTDALVSYLPKFYDSMRGELWQVSAKNKNNVSDVLPIILLAANNGKYVYYRGDHHLTALGSYYVYKSLATSLGFAAYGSDAFSVGIVKTNFSGSDARKMLTETGDKIALFRYSGDSRLITENLDSGEKYDGLYDFDKLISNDPYGIFPAPDCGRVKITLGEGRENLLLVCDSYGDSLAPFLARHYDLDIIDPRYYGGSVKDLIKENNYTTALLCFGMDTLAGKEILYKLMF